MYTNDVSTTQWILDPVAPGAASQTVNVSRPIASLRGVTVGFIDNSKPNFRELVEDLGTLLVERHGVKAIVTHRKRSASIPAPHAVLDDLCANCDLVITGSGD
jgi:hypothetical protein